MSTTFTEDEKFELIKKMKPMSSEQRKDYAQLCFTIGMFLDFTEKETADGIDLEGEALEPVELDENVVSLRDYPTLAASTQRFRNYVKEYISEEERKILEDSEKNS